MNVVKLPLTLRVMSSLRSSVSVQYHPVVSAVDFTDNDDPNDIELEPSICSYLSLNS